MNHSYGALLFLLSEVSYRIPCTLLNAMFSLHWCFNFRLPTDYIRLWGDKWYHGIILLIWCLLRRSVQCSKPVSIAHNVWNLSLIKFFIFKLGYLLILRLLVLIKPAYPTFLTRVATLSLFRKTGNYSNIFWHITYWDGYPVSWSVCPINNCREPQTKNRRGLLIYMHLLYASTTFTVSVFFN